MCTWWLGTCQVELYVLANSFLVLRGNIPLDVELVERLSGAIDCTLLRVSSDMPAFLHLTTALQSAMVNFGGGDWEEEPHLFLNGARSGFEMCFWSQHLLVLGPKHVSNPA